MTYILEWIKLNFQINIVKWGRMMDRYSKSEIEEASPYFGLFYMYYINEDDAMMRKSVLMVAPIKIKEDEYDMVFTIRSVSSIYHGQAIFNSYYREDGNKEKFHSFQLIGRMKRNNSSYNDDNDRTKIAGCAMFEIMKSNSSANLEGIMLFRSVGVLNKVRSGPTHISAKRFLLVNFSRQIPLGANQNTLEEYCKKPHCWQGHREEFGEEVKYYDDVVVSRTRFGAMIIGI